MKTLDYNCRMCGRPGKAEYDPDCPVKDLDAWRAMLTCDRCYDYRWSMRKIYCAIRHVCLGWEKQSQSDNPKVRKSAEEERESVREILTWKTKDLAHTMARYHGIQSLWDIEFVNLLMDQPGKVQEVLRKYIADQKQRAGLFAKGQV